jgi:hypothetical protein
MTKPPNANAKKRAIIHIGKYEKEVLKHWTPELIKALADDMLDWFRADSSRIWLQDYFNDRLISRNSITRILNRDSYFAEIYTICKSIQESRLFHAGFRAEGNINQVIFALKNVSKWRNEPKEDPDKEQPVEIVMRPTQLAESDKPTDNKKPNL